MLNGLGFTEWVCSMFWQHRNQLSDQNIPSSDQKCRSESIRYGFKLRLFRSTPENKQKTIKIRWIKIKITPNRYIFTKMSVVNSSLINEEQKPKNKTFEWRTCSEEWKTPLSDVFLSTQNIYSIIFTCLS